MVKNFFQCQISVSDVAFLCLKKQKQLSTSDSVAISGDFLPNPRFLASLWRWKLWAGDVSHCRMRSTSSGLVTATNQNSANGVLLDGDYEGINSYFFPYDLRSFHTTVKPIRSDHLLITDCDDNAFGAGTLTWQDQVHSRKAGPGEVMTVKNYYYIILSDNWQQCPVIRTL